MMKENSGKKFDAKTEATLQKAEELLKNLKAFKADVFRTALIAQARKTSDYWIEKAEAADAELKAEIEKTADKIAKIKKEDLRKGLAYEMRFLLSLDTYNQATEEIFKSIVLSEISELCAQEGSLGEEYIRN